MCIPINCSKQTCESIRCSHNYVIKQFLCVSSSEKNNSRHVPFVNQSIGINALANISLFFLLQSDLDLHVR